MLRHIIAESKRAPTSHFASPTQENTIGGQSNDDITFLVNQGELSLNNSRHKQLTASILKRNIRNGIQIRFLQIAFQNISFFKEAKVKLSSDEYKNMMKALTYEEFKKGDVLFNYGEFPSSRKSLKS